MEPGHNGRGEIAQLTSSFNAIINRTRQQALTAQSISCGNLNVDIDIQSKGDVLAQSLSSMTDTFRMLLLEIDGITNEVIKGNLGVRGNGDVFEGEWKTLVNSLNNLIEVFVKPIHVTAEYVDRISRGEIPPKIKEEYLGDFNKIKKSLNNCIDIMNNLISETRRLILEAQEGRLDERGNDASFTGGWKELISGVNALLETVVLPVKEIAAVMGEISRGNLEVSVNKTYKGDFAEMTRSVNTTLASLKEIIGNIAMVLGKISEGNLDIDTVKGFEGSFESISNSMNRIVDALNLVMGEISHTAGKVSSASEQVSDESGKILRGATEQDGVLEGLAASIAEIADRTSGNAKNAGKANKITREVLDKARQGNLQMAECWMP